MPVTVHAKTRRMSQEEFGELAYEVMECVFAIHKEMGRFFDEDIYRNAIAHRFRNAQTKIRIEVCFEDFIKEYSIDLLIEGGVIFELKAVNALHARHRSQLLNYLFLTELSHGKLINLGTDRVEHEFINTSLALADRVRFAVDEQNWNEPKRDGEPLSSWIVRMLRHLGTGLDLDLYKQAVTHFLGGEEQVVREIEILDGTHRLGIQRARLIEPGWAFKITAIDNTSQPQFKTHARRFLQHTQLQRIQWINITRDQVTLTTLEK